MALSTAETLNENIDLPHFDDVRDDLNKCLIEDDCGKVKEIINSLGKIL